MKDRNVVFILLGKMLKQNLKRVILSAKGCKEESRKCFDWDGVTNNTKI